MLSRGARSSTRWTTKPRLAIHGPKTVHCLPIRCITAQTTDKTTTVVPLRKQLKDEAKQKRLDIKAGILKPTTEDDLALKDWELTVGIEIHAELNTARKLFSDAATSSNEEPNSNVSLFDLAYPGSQPIFQIATLLPALRAAIALNCDIQHKSSFDRKHYFYQDQPAGYQITQYYEPFAKDGRITLYKHDGIAPEDGEEIVIGIKQVQMEQDTAKTIQETATSSLLDFNRVSHPLIEIITLPHIHHPSTAAACVRKVQAILKSVNACTAGMEIGGLRADVNVSVRRRHDTSIVEGENQYYGVTGLGQRTEIKNLSSFKAVEDAVVAERNRQIRLLENGGVVEGETRGWTLGSTETRRLRGKEGEVDYRYMPDPDIQPVFISDELIHHLRSTLPALPDSVLTTLTTDPTHGLTMKDAKTLLSSDDGDRLEYYFDVLALLQAKEKVDLPKHPGRVVGNWVIHELGGLFSKAEIPWSAQQVPSSTLAAIISKVLQEKISHDSGKKIMAMVFAGDERRVGIIAKENKMMVQNISGDIYTQTAEALVRENPEIAKAIQEKGQMGKIMWFVGQMMKTMSKQTGEGGVKPDLAKEAIMKALDKPAPGGANSGVLQESDI
ncbi:Glutamyl-tRNA amidotransferase subunit B [Venturia nashicola]|uniref:Glutamyl-tRNA(Gln) amidotransferase subunit B, mitochondrial n=1 Tax=Venturia nashicola TaxID=86259 RepID=A0A4Z1PG57_9PEZI|nr:Glutamyl-tRNA amidotransferase subunit B [Venturia nashicola]